MRISTATLLTTAALAPFLAGFTPVQEPARNDSGELLRKLEAQLSLLDSKQDELDALRQQAEDLRDQLNAHVQAGDWQEGQFEGRVENRFEDKPEKKSKGLLLKTRAGEQLLEKFTMQSKEVDGLPLIEFLQNSEAENPKRAKQRAKVLRYFAEDERANREQEREGKDSSGHDAHITVDGDGHVVFDPFATPHPDGSKAKEMRTKVLVLGGDSDSEDAKNFPSKKKSKAKRKDALKWFVSEPDSEQVEWFSTDAPDQGQWRFFEEEEQASDGPKTQAMQVEVRSSSDETDALLREILDELRAIRQDMAGLRHEVGMAR